MCPDVTPSLSPKATVTLRDDDHLAFADSAPPRTVRNLRVYFAGRGVIDPERRIRGVVLVGCERAEAGTARPRRPKRAE